MAEQLISDVSLYIDMQEQFELYCQKPFKGRTASEMSRFIDENAIMLKGLAGVRDIGFQAVEGDENWQWAVAVFYWREPTSEDKKIIESLIDHSQPVICKIAGDWPYA